MIKHANSEINQSYVMTFFIHVSVVVCKYDVVHVYCYVDIRKMISTIHSIFCRIKKVLILKSASVKFIILKMNN